MSIQAFSQESLDQLGVRSVDDLTRVSPGVTFIRNGMSSSGNYNDEDSDISIRGIDSTAGTATTGIYVDDTPIQTRHLNFGTVNPYPALFDLDRVEVLKGPQGTLFGAGSEGGTIRFITPDPSLTTYPGYARAEFGQIDNGGTATGAARRRRPDHRWRARLSGQRLVPGGWWLGESRDLHAPPNADGAPPRHSIAAIRRRRPNANWREHATFRVALKWQPIDGSIIRPCITNSAHQRHRGLLAHYLGSGENVYNNGNAQRDPSTDPLLGRDQAEVGPRLRIALLEYLVLTIAIRAPLRTTPSTCAPPESFGELPNPYPAAGDQRLRDFHDHQRNFYEEIRLSPRTPTRGWCGAAACSTRA